MGFQDDVEREWFDREQRIVRYCAGRMAADEESAFEIDLLQDAQLAGDVELAMVLRDSLQEPGAVRQPKAPRANKAWWMPLAAGLVLGAVGTAALQHSLGRSFALADVEYLTLDVVRGVSALPDRTLSLSDEAVLIIEVSAQAAATELQLIHPDGRQESVSGTRDGEFLRIGLAAPVRPGTYTLISGDARHSFSVRAR